MKLTPQPPLSPGSQARERERVAVLLEINGELLKTIVSLQEQGKGGSVGQPAPGEDVKDQKVASREYLE